MSEPIDWPYPALCAHRGAGKQAPENTMAAMRVGAEFGYRIFEFDAKLSGDGAVILLHDDTVDRTTDGRGRAAQMGLNDLMRLDAGSWHSAEFAGEGIPTLARVIKWLLANDFMANIEIKPCPGREFETGAAVAQEADLMFRDADIAPLITSFSERALQGARESAPDLPRGLLCDALPDDWVDRCDELGCDVIDPHFLSLTEAIVDQAHDAGLRVATYTVNDPEFVTQLQTWGVDTVITDSVDLIEPESTLEA